MWYNVLRETKEEWSFNMRTKLADRQLPNYSIIAERFNYISHIVGGLFYTE